MMNDDKLFRDRLYNMEATYPDDMWNRISGQLPKKKRRGGWWLLLAFLLLGVVSGVFLPISNQAESTENYEEKLPSNSSASGDDIIVQSTPVEEGIDLNQEIAPTPSENKTAFIPGDINPENSGSYESYSEAPVITSSSSTDTENNIDVFTSEHDITPEIKVAKEVNNELENVTSPRALVSAPGVMDPRQLFIDDVYPDFIPPECPTFGFNREPGIFFDLLYSHDMPSRTLEMKSQELSDYIDSRNNTESTLYSFSSSLRIAYISRSGLGLKTGFNYSQINEKFEYLDPDASLIRTIITIDTLILGGVPTVVKDTSTIRIPGSLDITSYNRYRFFDIPILATYEAPLNDKFYYSFNGGVLINVAFSQKGRFLDPAEMPVWFTSSDPEGYDAFKNSAGLSFFGSLGLHYKLNDHIDIILEPNFRFYAGSLTSEPYPLEQRWLTLGLSHGIRYKF
ncbi:MAG: hypothetical protein HKN68_05590 [Saprospiraceae bacterium]|nr:hypothetical protein [Saprospiraceae bacterium]